MAREVKTKALETGRLSFDPSSTIYYVHDRAQLNIF